MTETLEQFRRQMSHHGLDFAVPIAADGKLHRFKAGADKARAESRADTCGPSSFGTGSPGRGGSSPIIPEMATNTATAAAETAPPGRFLPPRGSTQRTPVILEMATNTALASRHTPANAFSSAARVNTPEAT
jgi:hypothetical protein